MIISKHVQSKRFVYYFTFALLQVFLSLHYYYYYFCQLSVVSGGSCAREHLRCHYCQQMIFGKKCCKIIINYCWLRLVFHFKKPKTLLTMNFCVTWKWNTVVNSLSSYKNLHHLLFEINVGKKYSRMTMNFFNKTTCNNCMHGAI